MRNLIGRPEFRFWLLIWTPPAWATVAANQVQPIGDFLIAIPVASYIFGFLISFVFGVWSTVYRIKHRKMPRSESSVDVCLDLLAALLSGFLTLAAGAQFGIGPFWQIIALAMAGLCGSFVINIVRERIRQRVGPVVDKLLDRVSGAAK